MNKRTCGNCRWWNRHSGLATGDCQRRPPNSITSKWPSTDEVDFCGEWADGSITPEQEAKRELVRRFAVALTSGAVFDGSVAQTADAVWIVAQAMADAEPRGDK